MLYEEFVKTTDLSNHDLQFYLDGMNEENGEISGIFKRARRGDYGAIIKSKLEDGIWSMKLILDINPDIKNDLLKEIGDRHWYTTRLLQVLGSSMVEVEEINLNKLKKRKLTGTLIGKGDNRENEK